MIALIIRRIFQSLIVMLAVALVAFTLFRYVGDPVSQMVGQETSIADMERMRQELGLNDPVIVQFARFSWNTLQGKFGISYQLGRPVNELFVERLPATLELSLIAALFSLVVGIPMGVYTGLYPDRLLSKIFQTVSLIGISLPTFLIGILLIFLFGVILGLLPSFGRGEVVQIGFWSSGLLTLSGLKSLIMPSITLGMFQMTLILRLVRAEMLEVQWSGEAVFGAFEGDRDSQVRHATISFYLSPTIGFGKQIARIIAPEKFDGVYAPIGIDIGARTPAEIAICILAEIINVMRGGSAISLSEQIQQERLARRVRAHQRLAEN